MGINIGETPIEDLKLGENQITKVYLGEEEIWSKSQPPIVVNALRFTSPNAQTIVVDSTKLGTITLNMEYSTDGTNWSTWNVTTPLSFGGDTPLYIRGTNTFLAKGGTNYTHFIFSTASPVYCSGNIMHLFDYTQDLTEFPSPSNSRGVKYLFQNCTQLVEAPDSSIITGCGYMYYYMYDGCTSLVKAPDILATVCGDSAFNYMFNNCTSLVHAPKMASIYTGNTQMYEGMFYGCTNLEEIPLPRVTFTYVNSSMYNNMFRNCSKIKMSETQTDEYPNEFTFSESTPSYLSGNTTDMFTGTGGTFTGTPTQLTYYTSNQVVVL